MDPGSEYIHDLLARVESMRQFVQRGSFSERAEAAYKGEIAALEGQITSATAALAGPVAEQPQGSTFVLTVPPEDSVDAILVFAPKAVAAYQFQMPIQLTGTQYLHPTVSATSCEPGLEVSCRLVDFGRVLIPYPQGSPSSRGTEYTAASETITLCNQAGGSLTVELQTDGLDDASPFGLSGDLASQGRITLEPGQMSSIHIGVRPGQSVKGRYGARITLVASSASMTARQTETIKVCFPASLALSMPVSLLEVLFLINYFFVPTTAQGSTFHALSPL